MEMRARRIEQDGRHWTITHLRSLAGENRVKAALSRHVEQLLLTKESLQRHNTNLESIVQDRTEQLRAARDAADRANAAKSEFLSNMSHELRTPLHGVLSFARFGLKRYASAEREKLLTYFQRIESTGQTLLRLLNDLLDLSKLEAGAMTLELEPVDLFAVVSDVAEEFGALAREKRLSIQLPARQAPLQVWGDRARLLQVFRNLFGNAAKFTPEQGEIRVSATRSEGVVQIDVRDTGPGIPDGERQAVFDKFVQSKSAKGGKGGTGLGLAICREIILLHKGTISAEPTDGVGALLRVALPEYVPVAVAIHEDLYSSMAGAT
jgi:signal transduction histidine kinase